MESSCPTGQQCAGLRSVLCSNPCLTNLQLGNNALEDSGVRHLSEALKHPGCKLQKLGLIECRITGSCYSDLASVLRVSRSLTELDISANGLGDSRVGQLWDALKDADCKIQKLDLSGCCLSEAHWEGLASVLSNSHSLAELDLSGDSLGESGVRELCEGLKHPDCRLQKLHVKQCSITATCCADLSSALCTNRSLTELDLSDNALEDSGMRLLCEGLSHPGCRLQKLNVWSCSLTESCCADLSFVLQTNTSLTELILSDNKLRDSGVRELCEGLKHPGCQLQKLGMVDCSLTASCCADLASVFGANQSLTTLVLTGNKLCDSGVFQLMDGLNQPGCKIQTLLIDECSITSARCADIASLLRSNESLTELDLRGNELGDSGVIRLCRGLEGAHGKIQILGLESCCLTNSCCADLSSFIRTHPSLIELRLTGNKIGDPGVRELSEGLGSRGCAVQRLQMQHCSLTGQSCEYFSSVLKTNLSLAELELSFNTLGDSGAKLLFEGLRHPACKLVKLRIASCSLTDSCCADLSSVLSTSQSLTALDLSSNNLQDSGVRQLCQGLKHPDCQLQTLELYECSLTSACCGDLASAMRENRSLAELELSKNHLEGSGVAQLWVGLKSPGCGIQKLDLGYCSLTSSCCAALPRLINLDGSEHELQLTLNESNTLKSPECETQKPVMLDRPLATCGEAHAAMHLEGSVLRDGGTEAQCEGRSHPACKIEKLDINQCTFTESCCRDLASLLRQAPSLTELELSDNAVGDSGVRQLCEGLESPGCRVQKVGISSCSLTDSCCRDLASLLGTSESITELDLSDNAIQDSGVKPLCAALKRPTCKLRKLEMTRCSLKGACCEDLACALSANSSLRELDLSSNELEDCSLRRLCEGLRNPTCNLYKLRIINCSLTSACCEHLALAVSKSLCLTDLSLTFNELEDSGIKQLCEGLMSPSCRLRTLWLWSCSLTGECCASLSAVIRTSSSLTELDLGGNQLGDSGVRQLLEGLKYPGTTLKKLELSECALTASCCADLAAALSVNQSLAELNLSQNKLLDSGVSQLCEGLKHPNCKLQILWLDSCSLTSACCADLASVLCTNRPLAELHVADNNLDDCGARQIFEALKQPDCKLQKLWMWNCTLTESCCADLASVLRTSPSLVALEMCGNELGDAGIALLCEGLKQPGCKMQALGIGSCSFSSTCCPAIASVLTVNQSLTELDLSDNAIGDEGVIQLCEGFKQQGCKIPRLRLWGCSLTDACCAALSAVLGSNESLRELILSYNNLGDSGVKRLCEGLKQPNCRIQKLELLHCSFTGACSADLAAAVAMHPSLSDLDVADNQLGDSGVQTICDGLKGVEGSLPQLDSR